EELLQRQVERAERGPHLSAAEQVWVGERDGQLVVLVPDGRAQEKRPVPFQLQQQAGEEARALVVQALLAEAAGLDVAVMVEDGARGPVLEHPGPLVRHAGGGQDVVSAAVPVGPARRLSGTFREILGGDRLAVGHETSSLFGQPWGGSGTRAGSSQIMLSD